MPSDPSPSRKSLAVSGTHVSPRENSVDGENKMGKTQQESTNAKDPTKPSTPTQPIYINIPSTAKDTGTTLETDRMKTMRTAAILQAKLLQRMAESRSPPRLSVASPPGSAAPQSPLPSPQMPVLSPHRSPVAAVQSPHRSPATQSPHRSPGHNGVVSSAMTHGSASGSETTTKSLTSLHPRIAMSLNSPTAPLLTPAVNKERASEIAHQRAHDKYVAHLDTNTQGQVSEIKQDKPIATLPSQQTASNLCSIIAPKRKVSEIPQTIEIIPETSDVSLKQHSTAECDLEMKCEEVLTPPVSPERQTSSREKTVSPTPMAHQLVSMVASQSDKVRSIMVQARHCQQNATSNVRDQQNSSPSTACKAIPPSSETEVTPIEIVPIKNLKCEEEETDVKQLPNIANLAAFVPTSNKNVVPPPMYVSTASTLSRTPEPVTTIKYQPVTSLKKNSVSSSSSCEHPTLVKQLEGAISGVVSAVHNEGGKVVPVANVNPMLSPTGATIQSDPTRNKNGALVDSIPGILAQGSLSDWQAELAAFKKTLRMPPKLIFVPKTAPPNAVGSMSQTLGNRTYGLGVGDMGRSCGFRGGRGRGRGKRMMRPTVKNLLAMRESNNLNTTVDVNDTKALVARVSSNTSLLSPPENSTTPGVSASTTDTSILSPKIKCEQTSICASSQTNTPILKIPSVKPKLSKPESTVPPIRLTLKNGPVPSVKIKSTVPSAAAFSPPTGCPNTTTSSLPNKRSTKKKPRGETAKKAQVKGKASLDTREFSIKFVKKFGKKSTETVFEQTVTSLNKTPQTFVVKEEPTSGEDFSEKSCRENAYSSTSSAINGIYVEAISTDPNKKLFEQNKVNSHGITIPADCLSAGKPKRIRRLPKKFRTDSPPLPLTPKRTKSSPSSPKSPKSPKSPRAIISSKATVSPKSQVSPRAPVSPGTAGKFKIVKDPKQNSPLSNGAPLSPIKLGRVCLPPNRKKPSLVRGKKRKGSDGGSPTMKQKRSRRSILDELASSDGYVAEKKENRKSDDLFADPSTLSREERALQRAMIQFTAMEMKESKKAPTERITARNKKSNTRQKADALMRKAIRRQRSEKAKPEPKYLDFQPEILITRTRTQRAVLNGETPCRTKYHKDTAYEEELKREEQRREELRAKRKQRLEQERNGVQYVQVQQQENTCPPPVTEIKIKVEPPDTSSYEFKENDNANDGFWEIEPSRTIRLRRFEKAEKGRLTMKLHWRPSDAKRRAIKHATARAAKSIKRSRVLHHKPWLFRRYGRKRRRGFKTLRKKKVMIQQDPIDLELGSELVQEGVSDNYLPDIDESATDEMFQFESSADQFGELRPQTISGQGEEDQQPIKTKDDTDYDESQIPVPAELKKLSICRDTGETVLHRAARLGYEDVALYCAQTKHVDLNARDNAGYTPLHECCVSGNWEIAGHLLQYGADVNVSSLDGVRPLHDAVENDHIELVRLLLWAGADPLLATYSGRTVDDMANTDSMKKFLKGHYADMNGTRDGQDDMPWFFEGSSVLEKETSDIFEGLPKDEEDDDLNSQLELEFSGKPHLPSFNLSLDTEHGPSNYILLSDVLEELEMKRHVFFSIHGNLTIRSVPVDTILTQISQSQINDSGSWILGLKNSRQQCMELVKLDDQLRHILGISVETPLKCLISGATLDDAQNFFHVDEEKEGDVIEISDTESDSLYKEVDDPVDDASRLNVTEEHINLSSDALDDSLDKKAADTPAEKCALKQAAEETDAYSGTPTDDLEEKVDTPREETGHLSGAVEQLDTSTDIPSDNSDQKNDETTYAVSQISALMEQTDVCPNLGTKENTELAVDQTTDTEINGMDADEFCDSPGSIELCRNDDDSGNSSSSTCAYSDGELEDCDLGTGVVCQSNNLEDDGLPNQGLDVNNVHNASLSTRAKNSEIRKKRGSKFKQTDSAESNLLNSGVPCAHLKNVTGATAGDKPQEGVVSHDSACSVVDSGTEEDRLQVRGQSGKNQSQVEPTDKQVAVVPALQSGYTDAFGLDAVALAMREAGLVESDNSMDTVLGSQGSSAYDTNDLIVDSQPHLTYTMKVATTPEECFMNEDIAAANMLSTAAYMSSEQVHEPSVKTDALCNIKIAEVCSLRECSGNLQSASPDFLPPDGPTDLHTIEKYDDQTVPDDGQ